MKISIKKHTLVIISIFVIFCLISLINVTKAQAVSGFAGKIWKSSAKLKASKSDSSKTLAKLGKGKKVTVYGTSGQWRKISYKGKTGYVRKKYVYISTSAPALTGKSSTEKGQLVASFAKRFTGNQYRYGRQNLNNGADCSGFVRAVYKAFGYNIPRSSSTQRRAGRKVSTKKMREGDIVVYSGHVAVYIGGGKIVHASSPSTGIKITRNYRYRRIVSIRRVVS